jgi:hypothetical protein
MTPKQKAEEIVIKSLGSSYGQIARNIIMRIEDNIEQALTEARVEELERLFKVAWIDDCIIKRIAALKAGKGGGVKARNLQWQIVVPLRGNLMEVYISGDLPVYKECLEDAKEYLDLAIKRRASEPQPDFEI